MVTVVQIEQTGASNVMRLVQEQARPPGPGEVWIEHTAIGVNPLDVTQRAGVVPLKQLPSRLGLEGVGKITAIGEGVTNVKVGDRAGYVMGPLGAYSSGRLYPADRLIKLPDSLDDVDAAALLFKGITAEYLVNSLGRIDSASRILVYGASGAVGQLLVPWAKSKGAFVIGVVSKEVNLEKAALIGCDAAFVFDANMLPQQVSEATNGQKVDIVYDGLGRISFEASLDCLRPRGLMVSFGMTTGAAPAVEMSVLNAKGSLFITRPSLAVYTAETMEYQQRASRVIDAYTRGIIKPSVGHRFGLEDVVEAHDLLESGAAKGAVVLTV